MRSTLPAERPALARLLLLALVASLSLAGCRSGSALHSRYDNFRAYYNTYYNATRSLEEGERQLERAAVTVDRSRLVPVFPETAGAGGTSGPFQDAIDKSAELLRNRPGSKWADDALLLIGKAYFYQRNLAGAEQKFRETMAASELGGDRRLGDEARFWLGRTYAASDRYDEGVSVLEEGLADEGGDRRWTARTRLALGELYARAGRWDEAAETLRIGAPDEGDADVAARAYVLLGQVEEHSERWDQAADAYQLALDRRPAYELAFAAQVGRALVLGVDAGQTADGLEVVRRMRGDDKNFDRRGELALVEARVQAAAGETGSALRLYREVLYEAELNTPQPIKGQAHYRLAEFYRDALNDYVRASAHFDTAATALRAPAATLRASRDAILDVSDEARTYAVLASAARRIADADSLLALGALSDDAFRERIEAIETERRRVYVEEQRRLNEARTTEQFQGTGGAFEAEGGSRRPASPAAIPGDRQPGAVSGGFLSHRDGASVQAGQIAFVQRWGDRPLVPGWRRRASILSSDLSAARGVVSAQVQGGLGLAGGPLPLNLTAVPRTPAKRNEIVTELAGLRYELANAFFLSLGRADTAAVLYRSILSESPDLPVATRARYALAEIERAAGRDEVARPLYEAVVAADTSALARASRVRLGEDPGEIGAGPVETSAAYDAARARWRGGDPLGGMRDLIRVGDARPEAETAPRAYLAAAAAYIDWAGADTLSLTRPLPDSLISPLLLAQAIEGPESAEPPSPEPDDQPLVDRVLPLDGEVPEPGRLPADEERPAPAVRLGNSPRQLGVDELAPRRPGEDLKPIDRRQRTLEAVARPGGVPSPRAAGRRPPQVSDIGALAVPDSASFTLRHHLAALAIRYPGTAYAQRALALATALPIPEIPVETFTPDSTATGVPVAEETVAPGLFPDSVATSAFPDPEAPAADSVSAQAEPPDGLSLDGLSPDGLRGETPPDPSSGGYTWRVQRVTLAAEAAALVGVLESAGYRAATLRAKDRGDVVVVIGQFETEAQAEAARSGLPAWAQIRGEIIPLDSLEPVGPSAPDEGGL